MPCDCHEQLHGKMISAFFHGAKSLWWMSEQQESRYLERFPFLRKNDSVVLSSVFDDKFFAFVNSLRDQQIERKGWIVLGSNSWIKGYEDAEQYCKDNNLDYEVVWGLPYEQLLMKLAQAEGFVYLPRGGEYKGIHATGILSFPAGPGQVKLGAGLVGGGMGIIAENTYGMTLGNAVDLRVGIRSTTSFGAKDSEKFDLGTVSWMDGVIALGFNL